MEDKSYIDFELLIRKGGQQYEATVVGSRWGEFTESFEFQVDDLKLENLILRLGHAARTVRQIHTPEMERARDFGRQLFKAVFHGGVQTCLARSLDEARDRRLGLRLKLRLEAPELINVPWEFLYDEAGGRFLALFENTPIVRYLSLPEPPTPLEVTPPLSLLVMISSPSDYDPLDVEKERANLQKALKGPVRTGKIRITWIRAPRHATLSVLGDTLLHGTYHVFHYIGHSGFDESGKDGVLVLEDERSRSCLASGEHLAVLLGNHPSLRLAVLNACESARTSTADPYAGIAGTLVRTGRIPAVVAMQLPITDRAAIQFTAGFYDALALGRPVDAAVTVARRTIFTSGNNVEWATPVLYMRAPDGRIFDITEEPTPPSPAGLAGPLYEQATRKLQSGDRAGALRLLKKIRALDPSYRDVAALIEQVSRELKVLKALEGGKVRVEQGEWQTVFKALDQSLARTPDDAQAQLLRLESEPVWLYEQAAGKLQAKDWSGALAQLEQIRAQDPAYRDVPALIEQAALEVELSGLLKKGMAHFEREEWPAAIEAFEQALDLSPGQTKVQQLLDEARTKVPPPKPPRPDTLPEPVHGRPKPTDLPK